MFIFAKSDSSTGRIWTWAVQSTWECFASLLWCCLAAPPPPQGLWFDRSEVRSPHPYFLSAPGDSTGQPGDVWLRARGIQRYLLGRIAAMQTSLCAQYWARCLNARSHSFKIGLNVIIPFDRWGNGGTDKLSPLSQVTRRREPEFGPQNSVM